MPTSSPHKEAELLQQLRQVLLSEDREALEALRHTLEDEQELSKKVSPIIHQHLDRHLNFVKENFSEEYGSYVRQIVRKEIQNSQDEIVELISPRLMTMVRGFITSQFQILKDRIDEQLQNVRNRFSPKNMWRRLFGASESDIILSNLDVPEIHELYLIQRDTGLLMGSFSKGENLDQDVIAGMLTAIKDFGRDAFHQDKENLSMISYEHYKIYLQHFPGYYFAVAMTGSISEGEKMVLSEKLGRFATTEIPAKTDEIDSAFTSQLSEKLERDFLNYQIAD